MKIVIEKSKGKRPLRDLDVGSQITVNVSQPNNALGRNVVTSLATVSFRRKIIVHGVRWGMTFNFNQFRKAPLAFS
jgi:hypothetical protein